jgi:hypothetical protein
MSKPISAVTGASDVKRHRGHERNIEILQRRSSSRLVIWGDATDPEAPAFANGWGQRGDPYQPLSFYLLLGGHFELLGSPSGGTLGTSCGTLPAICVAHLTGKIPANFVDDAGTPIGGWVLPDGSVIVGNA